ncbi:sulfotransferase-like protein [Pontimonas salivibrio]|uniref:Sulfotransferase-like protein n=1 Tax=Pontimonas salivibrio TaxID=1159327 RepID=A0A2L2BSP2_9MICO|nr:sulfotransferase family 2 domain-containing protein [Pontimonas salivibrio]AVG24661.1 sulfotransferase-like protein [Pontimonas salivibrio]
MGFWNFVQEAQIGISAALKVVRRRILRKFRKVRNCWLFKPPRTRFCIPCRQRISSAVLEKKNLQAWRPIKLASADSMAAVFIHIPKTGGTSLRAALTSDAGFEAVQPGRGIRSTRVVIPHHNPDWLIKKGLLNADELADAFSFVLVRDPVDRAISSYRYALATKRIPAFWKFEDFLLCVKRERPQIGGFMESRMTHAAPQVAWLQQSEWSGPSQVYRIENLSNSISELSEKLEKKIQIPFLNRSTGDKPSPSTRAKELIASIYSADFEFLGYEPPL